MLPSNPANPEFEALLDYLKRSRSFDFTGYKRPSLMRRIRRQMSMVGIESFNDYTDLLETDPGEVKRLLNTILINVTGFFRDAIAWEFVEQQVIPQIIASKPPGSPIRVWSAGCATGEEPYSLAILLAEALGIETMTRYVRVHATDLDEDALTYARQATYLYPKVAGVPAHLLQKYFLQTGDRYVLDQNVRRTVIFGRHDLTQDVPISRLDLLACRNTLMYLNAEVQDSVLARFHFALNNGGYLFLGKAEMLMGRNKMFVPLDIKRRIFVKTAGENVRMSTFFAADNDEPPAALPDSANLPQNAFQSGPLAQIIVGANGVLMLANERACTLFRLTSRDLGQPFQNLELSYRPAELRPAIDKVYESQEAVLIEEVNWIRTGGERSTYNLQITPLPRPGVAPEGVCISFLDVSDYKRLQQELETSNLELTTACEEAQSSAEELETTNEELQSANEEMETINEELQSSNEELETTNSELRQRSDELTQITEFMEAILSSLPGGVIVVGMKLQVLAWNAQSENLWGLRFHEVVGKSLASLEIGLPIERVYPLVRACLAGTSQREELTMEAINRRGRSIVCKLACNPVKSSNGDIVGAMLIAMQVE